MTKEELLEILSDCAKDMDIESAHISADGALLDFINDPDISDAFKQVPRYYS